MVHVLAAVWLRVQVWRAVPDRLSLPETEDAAKYAQVASVAYKKDVDEVRSEGGYRSVDTRAHRVRAHNKNSSQTQQ